MSVVDPVVRNDLSQIRERLTLFPQMETVLQELSTGIKVIDSYDDHVMCLNHIHEDDLQQDYELSSSSMRLMQKLKKRTSANDIPMTLINMLDAARIANDRHQKSKNQRGEWRTLFRSPSSTHTKRCTECHKEKLRHYKCRYLLEWDEKAPPSTNQSWCNQSTSNSARSAATPTQNKYKHNGYDCDSNINNCRNEDDSTASISLSRPRESNKPPQKPGLNIKSLSVHNSTISLRNSQMSNKTDCSNSKHINTSKNYVPNNNSATKSNEIGNSDMSCRIKSKSTLVAKSIQCSIVEVPPPDDAIIYPKVSNSKDSINEEIEDRYSTFCNASSISSTSSRYQGHGREVDDLEEAFTDYLKSQNLSKEQQIASLGKLKRIVEKMDVCREKPQGRMEDVSRSVKNDSTNRIITQGSDDRRVESVSVSAKTVIYKTTPVKTYEESSTLDSYFVHQLSIPPNITNSQHSILEKNDETHSKKLTSATFVDESQLLQQSTMNHSLENLKRKQHKVESTFQERAFSKRKNSKPVRKEVDTDGRPTPILKKFPSPSSCDFSYLEEQNNMSDSYRRVTRMRKSEIGRNDITARRIRMFNSYAPLMPASEPIMKAKAHMYPTSCEPVKVVKEKYDEEFDLTSRDVIEKFLKHISNHSQ